MRSTYMVQVTNNESAHQRKTRRSRRFSSNATSSKRQKVGRDIETTAANTKSTENETMNNTEMTNNNDNNQSTANREEPTTEQREDSDESPVAEDITPAVTWTNSEDSDNNDTDASSKTDTSASGDHTPAIESGTTTTSPVPFVEDPIVVNADMKRLTNPEMACVMFNDGNKDIICCTKEKMDDCAVIVNGKKFVVLDGTYSGRLIIPEKRIIEAYLWDDEDRLCKELVVYSASLAFHTSTVLLVCKDAAHFGDVASIIASFYSLFRNLDVNTCLYRIQRGFCDQCPSSFGRSYVMEGLATKVSALCRIQQATDMTVFHDKNVGSIVGEIYERDATTVDYLDSLIGRNFEDRMLLYGWIGPEEDYYALLNWAKLGPKRLEREYPEPRPRPGSQGYLRSYLFPLPSSAIIHENKGTDTYQDCPDWIGELGGPMNLSLAVPRAVLLGSIPACSSLLSMMGREGFFLFQTDEPRNSRSSGRTPLYLAAQRGDLPLVCWMLRNGGEISLEKETKKGRTPMYAAFASFRLDVIKILILHGAAMSCTFLGENTILSWISARYVEEVRIWIKKCLITLQRQHEVEDVMDSTKLNLVKHLRKAHRCVLEYYHELYHENHDDVVSLNSLDHGDHDFLEEDDDDETPEEREERQMKDLLRAASKASKLALLERMYPDLHSLMRVNLTEAYLCSGF